MENAFSMFSPQFLFFKIAALSKLLKLTENFAQEPFQPLQIVLCIYMYVKKLNKTYWVLNYSVLLESRYSVN